RFLSKLLTNPTSYVILLLLTYTVGYLTATTTTISKSSPQENPTKLDNFRVTTHCADPVPPELVRGTVLEALFDGVSPYDDFPPPHVSNFLSPYRIKGWGSNGVVFRHLIQKVKPRVIIEVGTFLGASALHMANLTRELGLQTQILCVDDFRGWPGFRRKVKDIKMLNGDVLLMYQFMQNVIHLNMTRWVLPLPFSSVSALQKLCEVGVWGDLIEIDGGHDFNTAWSDINRAYRILRPGGVIFGHDYFTSADSRGVRRAVNLFAQLNGLNIQIDGQHWVI
ncbi:Methyltransf_24 domain-containing protein, partial [Cephalotus follicularis]